jgi:DNA-directed RNA polymerase specialized sigma24 family protein
VLFVVAVDVYLGKPKTRQGAALMAMWKNELADREQTRARPSTVRRAGAGRSRAIYRGPVIEAMLRRRLTRGRLDAALAQFPASQRELFLAHYQHGRPAPALASARRMPTGQVQALLVRMAEQVAKELGPNWQKLFLRN